MKILSVLFVFCHSILCLVLPKVGRAVFFFKDDTPVFIYFLKGNIISERMLYRCYAWNTYSAALWLCFVFHAKTHVRLDI